jgi:trehalose 6-phosphate synthase/phosphatase
MKNSGPHDVISGISEPAGRRSEKESRLLVMSNRAPIRLIKEGGRERIEPTVGGVGSTFLRLLERHGGFWIAWSGGQHRPGPLLMPPGAPRFAMLLTRLSERDISGYYYGVCNRALWPLMHFMVSKCVFETAHWESYRRVNQMFAATAEAQASRFDVAWIQDFHLALVPGFLREKHSALPIGLFWHVPWPPEQVFRIFPWRNELLLGMLGSDLIGFHTRPYVKHFLDCCERILGYEVDRETGTVHHDSRMTKVGAFPLGIPADYFVEQSTTAEVRGRARRIRKMLRTPTVILSVDRLDYTKGILERLLAFERFLELNPHYRKQVTLVLIAVPSRTKVAEYAALKRQLDELVGRVMGRFSSDGWAPIRYLYTQFRAEELIAYYQVSDIALVTPLRDGMNLIAKEYIASQVNDSAVLILSEFAGAAEELTDALPVNPYDTDEMAARIKQAIEMPVEEKQRRFRRMRSRVETDNLDAWSDKFLGTLQKRRLVVTQSAVSASA